MAADPARVVGIVGAQALGDVVAVGVAHDHRIAALERALDAVTPAGSRLLPRRSARAAPASIRSTPIAASAPAIQSLRARRGLARATKRVQGPPAASRASGRALDARGDDHGAAGAGGDPGGGELADHAAGAGEAAGAAGHRLDLRRDRGRPASSRTASGSRRGSAV